MKEDLEKLCYLRWWEGQREALDRVTVKGGVKMTTSARSRLYCKVTVDRRVTRPAPHTRRVLMYSTIYIARLFSDILPYKHALPRGAICIRP